MSRTVRPIDEVMDEGLCVRNALVRLGFDPSGVKFMIDRGGDNLAVVIEAQGKKFQIRLGYIQKTDVEEIKRKWSAKIDWWNAASISEIDRLWQKSHALNNAYMLVVALVDYGFRIPGSAGQKKTSKADVKWFN